MNSQQDLRSNKNSEYDSILLGMDPADVDDPGEFQLVDGEQCSTIELTAAMVEMSCAHRETMPAGLAEKLKRQFKSQLFSE